MDVSSNPNMPNPYAVPPNSPAPDSTNIIGVKRRKPLEDAHEFSARLTAKLREAEVVYKALIDREKDRVANYDLSKAKQDLACAVSAYKKGLVMENEVRLMRIKEKRDRDAKRARITHYANNTPVAGQHRSQLQQTEQQRQTGQTKEPTEKPSVQKEQMDGYQPIPPTFGEGVKPPTDNGNSNSTAAPAVRTSAPAQAPTPASTSAVESR